MPLLILLSYLLLTLSGCTQQETPKKVSLYKRAGSVENKTAHIQPNTLWFGFDLRLGPKEEVRIYSPFLKYLEKSTGKRFRIKFSEKYEDTVNNIDQQARKIIDYVGLDWNEACLEPHKYKRDY